MGVLYHGPSPSQRGLASRGGLLGPDAYGPTIATAAAAALLAGDRSRGTGCLFGGRRCTIQGIFCAYWSSWSSVYVDARHPVELLTLLNEE